MTVPRALFALQYLLVFFLVLGAAEEEEDHDHQQDDRYLRVISNQKEPCTLVHVEIGSVEGRSMSTGKWYCELSDLDTSAAGIRFVEIEGLEEADLAGKSVRSGESSLLAIGATISSGKLIIPPGAIKTFESIHDQGSPTEKGKGGRQLSGSTSTERVVMAVRVVSPDSSPNSSTTQIRNFVFGTSGDPVNLKERFESCSYREVLIKPYNGTTAKGRVVSGGIYAVSITTNATGAEVMTIVNQATTRLTSLLGDLASQFHHILLCLPRGILSNGGAWSSMAYAGHWLSWYNNEICNDAGHQFRQVGYNLGLSRSLGALGRVGDATCTMGLGREKTCFNAAKSSQLNWYSQRRIDLDFKKRGGFNGQLIGVSDYAHPSSNGKYVYVKVLGAPYNRPFDCYVGFNVAGGIHNDTGEGRNLVTVYVQDNGGSYFYANVTAGNTFSLSGFAGGPALNVRVNSIQLTASPPVADVDVFLEGCPPGVCGPNCNACCVDTDCPSKLCEVQSCQQGTCVYNPSNCTGGVFRLEMTTDNNPSALSWDVLDKCTGNLVLQGDSYASKNQSITVASSARIGRSRFTFTMRHSKGDGFINGGGFRVIYDGNYIANYQSYPYSFTTMSMEFGGGSCT